MIDLELVARCLSKETNQQIQVYKVLMPNAMVLKMIISAVIFKKHSSISIAEITLFSFR